VPPAPVREGIRAVIQSSDGKAEVRAQPSRTGAGLATVVDGEQFTLLEQSGDWWRVRTSSVNPVTGYMSRSLVRLLDEGSHGAQATALYEEGERLRREGQGKPNLDAARQKYLAAAGLGHAVAQCRLAVMYALGFGVKKDDKLACDWYRKSAEGGYAEAQHGLAVRYAKGLGVEQSEELAIKWYRRAAAQGDQDSMEALQRRGIGIKP
jgi:TPR repeat protein